MSTDTNVVIHAGTRMSTIFFSNCEYWNEYYITLLISYSLLSLFENKKLCTVYTHHLIKINSFAMSLFFKYFRVSCFIMLTEIGFFLVSYSHPHYARNFTLIRWINGMIRGLKLSNFKIRKPNLENNENMGLKLQLSQIIITFV
jgi:hypothetical protein